MADDWPDHYVLIGHTPVAVDLMTWARWLQNTTDARRVAIDDFTGGRVSTVFLGLDHSLGNGPPILFETLIFGGPLDGEQWRYCTWKEAETGHQHALALARKAADRIADIASAAGATVQTK
jgi:hypothetical protein